MNKAIYTLFHSSKWKVALTLVFTWCCLSLQTAAAQDIKINYTPNDTAEANVVTLDCDADQRLFADDGDNDGNYNDNTHERRDTIVICPEDAWHRVKLTFTDFDLAAGDTLHAFDGNLAEINAALLQQAFRQGLLPFGANLAQLKALLALPGNENLAKELFDNHEKSTASGSGTGAGNPFTSLAVSRGGVADAFGGWYAASCDPFVNSSGCVTFLFRTNDDSRKGAGWEAWASCEARGISLSGEVIPSDVQLSCENAPYDTSLVIVAPYVLACSDTLDGLSDSLLVTVKNEKGTVVKTQKMRSPRATMGQDSLVGRYGVGCYTVTFALISDPSADKTITRSFCVKAPSLVCNDEVNTVFGAACQLSIAPDMVLEATCDSVTGILEYQVKLTYGNTSKTGAYGTIPTVTKDELKAAGAGACDGQLVVEITRRITAPAGACSNDPEIVKCTTVVKYTDNTAPVFGAHVPGIDTLIQADTAGVAALANIPTATDNCDSVRYESVIKSVLNAAATAAADPSDICAYPIKVVLEHAAYDECGNKSSTVQDTVLIIRPWQFTTPGIDTLECNAADPGYIASGAPKLQVGKYVNGVIVYDAAKALDVDTLNYTAGYILRFSDQVINDSDCGSKVFRAWSYVDWCNNSNGVTAIGTQFIHYFDQSAPMFTYTGADTLEANATKIDLDFGECTKAISPTTPSSTDGCDTDPTEAMFDVARKDGNTYTSIGANLAATGALGCDTFRISWRVYDDCHTQTVEDTIHRYFILQDTEDPLVTCEDEVFVSVSTSAGVMMQAATFYKTATDNCGTPTIEIRRENKDGTYSDWGQSILVQCTEAVRDVDHESFNVEVRVTDKNGRTNTCWVKVTPEDKIAPICEDIPDDIDNRTCNEFHNLELGDPTDTNKDGVMDEDEWVLLDNKDAKLKALAALFEKEFGKIACVDNLECGAIRIDEWYQLIEESCGVIRIKRRWSATDWLDQAGDGNTSQAQEQSIRIKYVKDWTLSFPKDETIVCNAGSIPAPATYEDIVRSGACDNILLNVTADTFRTPGETCMKIIRNYELINWCNYDANAAAYVIPHNVDGVVLHDEDVPAGQDNGRYTYSQVIKLDVSDGGITVTQNDVNTCIVGVGDVAPFGEADSDLGDLAYECDTLRTFSATATNCLGIELTKFSYRVTVVENGVDVITLASEEGNEVEVNVEPGKTYRVTFIAFDDCNNSESSEKLYTFRDCKRPTPFVLNGIAVDLGESGKVEVWAKDLDDNKTYDNCTPKEDLKFFISREERPADIDSILATGSVITLDCNDVGTRAVYIYVVDASNNWDVVRTTINVDSNVFDCNGTSERDGMVAGHIVNPNGENVEQVSVTVAGAMQSDMTTGADGAFQFELNTGADYTVTPTKDMNPLNGVSTFDLVLISKHILGITTFDSPYKYIAADVNKSGTITAFDMVQLRQLILSINTEFSNNDSWRFVDAEYDFSASTTNPAAQDFAEFKNISQLAANMMNVDFVGVKIGDVNGNASANSLLGAESRTTNGTLNFNVTDRLVEAGETVTVDFTSADIATAQGYQFTMNFAGLNFDGLTEGVASAANFNTNLAKRGMLTTSWNGEATADEVLFSLTFNATATGLLSELITVSSDLTAAEAYNTDGELLDVNIEFAAADVALGFALQQNIPNPFSGETVIGFNLPTAGAATLTVMDVQGKVLKEIRADYAKGYNTVVLKAKELTPGVLYYQLESADQVATKKMIIID